MKPSEPVKIRNPKRLHIPEEDDRPKGARGFPWLGIGDRLVLAMLKGEERETESGIILPDIKYGPGHDKELTIGMVVSQGAGEYVDGNFVSPEHDYGILPGDVLFIWPNSGQIINVHERELRVVSPSDVIMRLNREVGKELRTKIMNMVDDVIRKTLSDPDRAGFGTSKNPIPKIKTPDYEIAAGEARERMASAHGVRTKTQFLVKE